MSAKYTFLAWDTPVDDASTKLALLQLANNADDNGFSYYSISKMAKACDMSERNFMRKIQKLEAMKILTVERRANRPSLYTLIGDEMGVTICHLHGSEVTGCHAGVTGCHAGVTSCHPEGDKLSHDPIIYPVISPERVNAEKVIEIFHSVLPMLAKVQILNDKRKTAIRNFFKRRTSEKGEQFTIENFEAYLVYIRNNCQWMLQPNPKAGGGFYKPRDFDFIMTDRCYIAVKEQRFDNMESN